MGSIARGHRHFSKTPHVQDTRSEGVRGSAQGVGEAKRHANGGGTRLGDVIGLAGELPRHLQDGMRERPRVTLATVAGASFLVGALLGSRIMRAAILAAVPVAVTQLLRSELAEKAREYVGQAIREVTGDRPQNGQQIRGEG